ncbi:hypothetical protein [Gramella sp. KN1008]|uniref:hypothetical protein n=1 Tax=Gramella sp. KN1008 TaxID=2529298 RepID=UPI001038A1C7|nr:hypothetical protein [Gramella sp. KN1008]TBW27981.1 hypothetical protein EZJ28_09615 [Gramella sp. KN1008]
MKTIQAFILFLLFTNLSICQTNNQAKQGLDLEKERTPYESRKNITKFSLTSLAFRNFQFQYERVLNKTFSAGLTYSIIPKGDFPMKDMLVEAIEEEDINKYIQNSSIRYSSFTPEIRIYLGNGYGKGFYVAPFYRNTKYEINDVEIYYNAEGGGEKMVNTNGDISSNTFGLQIGSQFNLGSRIVLDWFIIGPHYGSSKGGIIGVAEDGLTSNEQEALRYELESVKSFLGKVSEVSYEVDSKGAKIDIDGPWAGVRAGISLGYRF